MAISKSHRQKIFDKFGGKCAYCGCELVGKWCVDHVTAILRKTKLVGGYRNKETKEYTNGSEVVTDNFWNDHEYVQYKSVPDGCHKPELDILENMMPSCFSCNHYKSSMDLENFRKQVGLLVGRLNKSFTQYKIAKRYGLVIEIEKPVVFYFETLNEIKNKP